MENKTSHFSLSGFSGILIGIFWLLGLYLVHILTSTYSFSFGGSSQLPVAFLEIAIISVGLIIIIISLVILWIRGKRRAKKNKSKLWITLSKKQRFNTLIPILGLLIILILIANKGYYSLATPLLLAFYGLVLLNLSRFNSKSLFYLALAQIILAVVAYFIYDKEFLLLGIGFGILPIIYGSLTFNKSKKQP